MDHIIDRHNKSFLLLLFCAAAMAMLTACEPTHDMQGTDPRDYYTQHPVVNKVESKNVTSRLHFNGEDVRLDDSELGKLRRNLRTVSPAAASGVLVQLASGDARRADRERHLRAVLRSMGYGSDKIGFESSEAMASGHARIDVQYAVVVPPDCPDWRRDPVTTYSNTSQGNFGCATAVNLGAMVADPNDLVRGSGSVTPDTQRAVAVVDRYHAGPPSSAEANAAAGGAAGNNGSDNGSGEDSGLSSLAETPR